MIKKLTNMLQKTWIYISIALVTALILRYTFGPEFIDMFGLIIFGGLITIGVYGLSVKKKFNDWILFALIVVGIFGVIMDGISSFNFLKSYVLGGLK